MLFVSDDEICLGFVEQDLHSMRNAKKEPVDVVVSGGRKVMELEVSCIVLGEDPIGQPAMEVRRKLQDATRWHKVTAPTCGLRSPRRRACKRCQEKILRKKIASTLLSRALSYPIRRRTL